MARFLALLLLILAIAKGAFADSSNDEVPPVEVHIQLPDGTLNMYSCWPKLPNSESDGMTVYINNIYGIAIYDCEWDGEIYIWPIPPRQEARALLIDRENHR